MNSTHWGVARGAATSTGQRTARLPFGRDAVPLARAQIVGDLVARGFSGQVVQEAESIVAELVSNSVRHASPLTDGTVRLHWQVRDGVVEVEVTDGGGPTRPKPVPPSRLGVAGRGLRIVRGLAHEWGVVDGPQGCTVWASVGGPSRRRAY
jgi:serine/threonine-protein kinase RsbW